MTQPEKKSSDISKSKFYFSSFSRQRETLGFNCSALRLQHWLWPICFSIRTTLDDSATAPPPPPPPPIYDLIVYGCGLFYGSEVTLDLSATKLLNKNFHLSRFSVRAGTRTKNLKPRDQFGKSRQSSLLCKTSFLRLIQLLLWRFCWASSCLSREKCYRNEIFSNWSQVEEVLFTASFNWGLGHRS